MAFSKNHRGPLIYYTADHLTVAGGIAHGFSSRQGGVSSGSFSSLNLSRSREDLPEKVRENYRLFCRAVGIPSEPIVLCHQIHSDVIHVVTEEDALPDLYDLDNLLGDGLITNRPGLTLSVFYADCIPVLLYDPVKRVIAAVHSGWRGTSRDIAGNAASKMMEVFGSLPEDILAAVGPGICSCCFETHEDVPEAMQYSLGEDISTFITPLLSGKFHVDLKGIIQNRLLSKGLLPEHIAVSHLCTSCHPDLFWSHRKLGGQRGNQAAMIHLLTKP